MNRTVPSRSLVLALTLGLTTPALAQPTSAQQTGTSAADRAAQKVAPASSPAVLCGLTLTKAPGTARSGNAAGKSTGDMNHAGDHSSGQAGSGGAGGSSPGNSGKEAAQQGVVAGKKVTGMDLCFAQQAATGDLFEIQSSRLAAGQAGSGKVKTLAAHLIRDHTQASAKLAALAPRLGITLPKTLPAPRLAEVNALRVQKGAGFDRAYAAAQVTAHEQAVNLFTAYLQTGGHPLLQAHARQTLPALKQHLQTARDLLKSVSGAKP